MRIWKNRYLISPLYLKLHRGRERFGVTYYPDSDYCIFYFKIRKPSKSGGTYENYNIYVEFKIFGREYQWSVCWRPDVFKRHLRGLKKEKEINIK